VFLVLAAITRTRTPTTPPGTALAARQELPFLLLLLVLAAQLLADMAGKTELYRGGRLPGWPGGMDNRRDSYDLTFDYLRDAVNVDVMNSGKIRRRRGIAQAVASSGAHSVFSDGSFIYWATTNQLKRADKNMSTSTLHTDVGFVYPLSYVAVNGAVYFSNEILAGVVGVSGYEPWGIQAPTAAPVLTAQTAGDIVIQVTATFVTSTGEESGAPLGKSVLVNDAQTILLSDIPVSSDARVTSVRIYTTTLDGDVFYQYADIPNGITSTTVQGPFGIGQALRTQFCDRPIPGQLIEFFNSHMFIATDNVLWYTKPYAFGLVDYRERYIQLPGRITLLKAVDDGLYLSAAGATYFLKDPCTPNMVLTPVLPYAAIEGAALTIPDKKEIEVAWMSERGIVVGSTGGQVKNITEERIAVDTHTRGCLGVVEYNGDKRFIMISQDNRDSPLVSQDFVESRQKQFDEVV
jgi:hypothetical protein